jgi:TonB family protein
MKRLRLAVLFAAFFACNAQAQETSTSVSCPVPKDSSFYHLRNPDKEPKEMPADAVQPSFPGGETEMLRFLSENIRYPVDARKNNIEGTVALTFVVEKSGAISNIAVLRDIGGGCAAEAARVIAAMPQWNPGTVDGMPVRVRYTIPISFKLDKLAQTKKKKWWQRDSLFGN